LVIPKEFLTGIQTIEIRRDRDQIILTSSAETVPSQRKDMFDIWQGQIWMADDFDAPLQPTFRRCGMWAVARACVLSSEDSLQDCFKVLEVSSGSVSQIALA
jgi:hypothetical protein